MNHIAIQDQLVDFLRSMVGQPELDAGTDLVGAGATDSLTMMDLMVFIETEFQLRLAFSDLNPDVFQTPATLAALIVEQQADLQRLKAA